MKNTKAQTKSAIKWQILKIGSTVLINFIYLFIISRLVSKNSFGLLAIANSSIALLTFFSEFGFGAALIQKKMISDSEVSQSWLMTIIISCFVSFLIIGASSFLSAFYNEPTLKSIIVALGITVLLRGFGVVSRALLAKELKFDKLFKSEVSALFFGNLFVGSLLAYFGFEVWALVGAYLFSSMLSSVMYFHFAPIKIKDIQWNKIDGEIKYILKYGASLTMVRFFHQLASQADKLVLGKLVPKSSVGVYDRSLYLISMPVNYYGSAFDSVVFSSFSRIQENTSKLKFFFYSLLLASGILFSFIFIPFVFYSRDIVLTVLGDQWQNAVIIFKILSLAIPAMLFGRFCDTYVRIRNLFHRSIFVKIIFLISIVASILFLYPYGISVVSLGILGSFFIHSIGLLTVCIKDLKSPWIGFLKFMVPLGLIIFVQVIFHIFLSTILGQIFSYDNHIFRLFLVVISQLFLGFIALQNIKKLFGQELYFLLKQEVNHPLLNKYLFK